MQDFSNEILDTIEKDKIVAFCADPVLFNAVKKYILAVAYKHGVPSKGVEHKGNINFALRLAWGAADGSGMPRTDEELGQSLRALTSAVQLVESGFAELTEFKKVEPILESNVNPSE
jgi:hypothetical protein